MQTVTLSQMDVAVSPFKDSSFNDMRYNNAIIRPEFSQLYNAWDVRDAIASYKLKNSH